MTIKNACKILVEIYRDGKKILNSRALVQEGVIYFADAKVNELDIIKVIPTKE